MTVLPSWVTRRTWTPKATSRAPGDSGVPRQTVLITPAQPFTSQLLPSPAQNEHPFWTTDERFIYFDSDRNSAGDTTEDPAHGFNIYRMDPSGSGVFQLPIPATGNKIDPSVSADSTTLAYVSGGAISPVQSGDNPSTNGFNLYYVSVNGDGTINGTPVQLTDAASGNSNLNFADVRHPSWSPLGTQMVFAGRLAGTPFYHIFMVDIRSGIITQLTDGPDNEYAPAWSTDNNFIAFTSNAQAFSASTPAVAGGVKVDDIWVIANNTSALNPIQVTSFSAGGAHAANKNPAWSSTKNGDPLGVVPTSLLAFASGRKDDDPTTPGIGAHVGGTFDIYFMPFTGVAVTGNDAARKLQTSTPGTGIDSTDTAVGFDPNYSSNEDYPAWPQYISSYRIAYQSDKPGSLNLYASTVVDINAPSLLIYNATGREIVHTALDATPEVSQRQFSPGDTVRLRARVVDYETGVKSVWIQIKNPNSQQQSADGQEHKIYDIIDDAMDGSPTSPSFALNVPHEFDCQAINPTTYAYRAQNVRNLYEPYDPIFGSPGDDEPAYSGILHPPDTAFWIQMVETPAGSGIYECKWKTPLTPSDWYIDVIVYDNGIDPFDPTQKYNWKIYDDVWGFTTQTFTPVSPLLYVNDYDSGQKFFTGRFSIGQNFGHQNGKFISYTAIPTESWMTEIKQSLLPTTYLPSGTGAKVTPLTYVQNTLDAPPGFGWDFYTGNYDQWRILSRGPLPPLILSQYGPHQETQPPDQIAKSTTPRSVTVSDRFVVWHSPYSGDLFTGDGTITDINTQANIQAFVNNGGRIFVDGQDIVWALTNAGNLTNPFVSQVLHVAYNTDSIMLLYQENATGEPNAKINLVAGRGTSPIATETWNNYLIVAAHGEFFGPGNPPPSEYPPSTGPLYIGDPSGNSPLRDWSAVNQYSVDGVTFIPTPTPGVAGVDGTFAGTGAPPAIMWYVQPDKTKPISKVLFSPFGWEALNPEFFAANSPPAAAGTRQSLNRRTEMMHNINDFMRTGRVKGQIRNTDKEPLAGVFVRIAQGTTVYGTAITDSGGNFVIDGVDAIGFFDLVANRTGYFSQTLHTSNPFHGGGETDEDIFLSPAQPGNISGIVTNLTTGAAVSGATVQATEANPAIAGSPLVFTAKSGTDGSYTIVDVPSGSYNLVVLPVPHYKTTTLGTPPVTVADSVPPQYTNVTVASQQNVTGQNFQLKPLPGHITGKVDIGDANGNDTGKGLPGVTVTATGAGSVTFTATTDANGNYDITADPGQYDVTASILGYALKAKVPVTVVTETITPNVNLIMIPIPPGTLAVRVHTSATTNSTSGVAVVGATVTVKDSNGNVIGTGTTGAEQSPGGPNFTLPNVPAGANVTVTAQKTGYNNNQPSTPVTVAIVSGQTATADITIDPLHTFDNTLSLVSSPYEYTTPVTQIFGISAGDVTSKQFEFVTWGGSSYIAYPTPPADTFHRGVGYFLADTSPSATLTVTTTDPQTGPTDNFPIHLKAGWNLIGEPFTYSVNFQALQVVDGGVTTDVTTAQSGSNPSLGAALWTYQSNTYQVTFTMDPWRGYWLRAYRDVDLIVGSSAQQNRAAKLNTRGTILDGNVDGGWKLNLTANAGTINSAPGIVGINRSATDQYDRFKLEAPPAVGAQGVTLTFNHTDWGNKSGQYSVDMRSALTTAQSWTFTVMSNVPNTPISLNWPDVATVPGKNDLILTDLDTQVKTSLRNRNGYTIPASKTNITRHFQLDVKRATRQSLQVMDLEAQVNRSAGGRAPASVGISYNLTADATVQVTIMQNGRPIRTLDAGATRAAGSTDLLWDLKNDQGLVVAGNTYTVEVRAADSDGRTVRRVVPLLITR